MYNGLFLAIFLSAEINQKLLPSSDKSAVVYFSFKTSNIVISFFSLALDFKLSFFYTEITDKSYKCKV